MDYPWHTPWGICFHGVNHGLRRVVCNGVNYGKPWGNPWVVPWGNPWVVPWRALWGDAWFASDEFMSLSVAYPMARSMAGICGLHYG